MFNASECVSEYRKESENFFFFHLCNSDVYRLCVRTAASHVRQFSWFGLDHALYTCCVCVQQAAMCCILPVWFGSCSVKVSVCVQQPTMCCNSPISWFGLDHTGCVCVQLAAMCCILLVWFGSCTVYRLRVRTAASHVRHSPGLVWITPPSLTPAFSSPTAAE